MLNPQIIPATAKNRLDLNKDKPRIYVICKTGFGMAITANKFKGIRCAAVYEEETARQAKEHLNVNMLALPAEYVNESKAIAMIRLWIGSEFLQGRYQDRVQMISDIEEENMK